MTIPRPIRRRWTGCWTAKKRWNQNKRKEDGALPAIRVLQIMPAMDTGGMETFVMNLYRAMDREKVQFDFLYHYDKPCFYDEEICALGGRITKLTVRQDNNLPKYLRELRAFFSAHPEYRVLHGHYGGFGMFYNTVARRCGVGGERLRYWGALGRDQRPGRPAGRRRPGRTARRTGRGGG